MPDKIYDIIPPKEIQKIPVEEPVFAQKPEIKKKNLPAQAGRGLKRFFIRAFFIILLIFVLMVAFSFLYFSKAKIELWPKADEASFTKLVVVDSGQKDSDPASWSKSGIIPGKVFNNQKSGSQEFNSSGKKIKEAKAAGVIRVYNNYSTSSQVLIANTRFVSSEGKLFKSTKKTLVPGGSYVKNKLVPGEIDVEVQAVESGEEYNIAPSTFSIPGFSGTPKYTAFYGKSSSNMTGGFKGEISQVTQDDLSKAKSALMEKLGKEGADLLKSSALAEGYVLLDEAISSKMAEETYSAKAGDEADTFRANAKIELKGLAFKKADMENYARNIIIDSAGKDKQIKDDTLNISYSLVPVENPPESEKIVLNTEIKSKFYVKIDADKLKRALAGKTYKEVMTSLSDQPQLLKVEINSGYFMHKRIPEDINDIEVKLNFNP